MILKEEKGREGRNSEILKQKYFGKIEISLKEIGQRLWTTRKHKNDIKY